MAKVIEGNTTWKATIRCAQGRYDRGVEGCFAVIEIEASDLKYHSDSDGDSWITCNCPSCGITLYPKWQLATIPASVYNR